MDLEDIDEVQHEEDKSLPEKNKRRRFKTPAQLQALEEFYNDHKYPTELMKAELAERLGLTEKQVSGWFCHRRLKDKRILRDEALTPGKQDLSSGVIQDLGSGLKQDSCSSTKQGDYRLADLREVDSQRFSRDERPVAEFEQRRAHNGTYLGDTSSESNSGLQESFRPQIRKPLDVGAAEYQAPNGFILKRRGPSGYLKIKGQTENSAITAVKRQLGRHYREDGPPLGIEFDPLPPGAFESPTNNAIDDGYGVSEAYVPSCHDMLGAHKRPSNTRKQEMYVETADYMPFHKADEDDFPYSQLKQKISFPSHSRAFSSGQKSSFGIDAYSARETSDYDGTKNSILQRRHDRSGRLTSGTEEPWSSGFDNLNPKVVRRKEHLDIPPNSPLVRHKDPLSLEDRLPRPPSGITRDEEHNVKKRPMNELHDSTRLKPRLANGPGVRKRGREELLQAAEYAVRTSIQELPQWSGQVKGSTMEVPLSFSEDETAETSSSVD